MPTRGLGKVGTPRPGRAARQWLLAIVVLAVAGGCAQPGTQASNDAAAPPATVTVGPNDGGKTVDLKVGDHLIVELGAAKQPSRLSRIWRLVMPRSEVLKRIDRDSTLTRVVLAAEAPGTVRLLLRQGWGCEPPLRCLMATPDGQSQGIKPPLRPLAITIHVQ
jgi:hypothetical protein